jgi:hypothetical protein
MPVTNWLNCCKMEMDKERYAAQYTMLVWKQTEGERQRNMRIPALPYEINPGEWEIVTPGVPVLSARGQTVERWAQAARYLLERGHSNTPEAIIAQVEQECEYITVTLTSEYRI